VASTSAPLSRAADSRILAGVAAGLVQVLIGIVLVVTGIVMFRDASDAPDVARQGMVATAAVFAGLALVVGPWWWRLTRDLAEERRERIRSQERAEVAAHVHDSVLQTLALIQRNAGDPRLVSTLARQQERELRTWLYGRSEPDPAESLAAALKRVSEEVEDLHGVPVDTVEVGDCGLDERLKALVLASREALANAARHSGAATVSAFLEVEPHQVTVFVRDRGSGFEAEQVPADRRGIAESIVGRMRRNGGRVSVRSQPGEGTEVELVMPR
jgi:signal transduction histidine kinase